MKKKYLKSSKNNTIYTNFLGFLTKNGNKLAAKKIVDNAFFLAAQSMSLPLHLVLIRIFFKLNSFVETKKISFKRSSHTVPFGITLRRRSYLILKWLMEVVREDKRRISTSKKLFFELINILKDKSSKSITKKNLNISQAIANRSNIHYRW